MKQEGKVGLLRKMVCAFRTMLLEDFPAVAFEKKNQRSGSQGRGLGDSSKGRGTCLVG